MAMQRVDMTLLESILFSFFFFFFFFALRHQEHRCDLLTSTRREEQLAIGATIVLVVLEFDGVEALANRARALVSGQNALAFSANGTLQKRESFSHCFTFVTTYRGAYCSRNQFVFKVASSRHRSGFKQKR
jgi:hypothetical protein